MQGGRGEGGPSPASGWAGESDSLMDQGLLVGSKGVPRLQWQALTEVSVRLSLLVHQHEGCSLGQLLGQPWCLAVLQVLC